MRQRAELGEQHLPRVGGETASSPRQLRRRPPGSARLFSLRSRRRAAGRQKLLRGSFFGREREPNGVLGGPRRQQSRRRSHKVLRRNAVSERAAPAFVLPPGESRSGRRQGQAELEPSAEADKSGGFGSARGARPCRGRGGRSGLGAAVEPWRAEDRPHRCRAARALLSRRRRRAAS